MTFFLSVLPMKPEITRIERQVMLKERRPIRASLVQKVRSERQDKRRKQSQRVSAHHRMPPVVAASW
jgi:hypothetical protein